MRESRLGKSFRFSPGFADQDRYAVRKVRRLLKRWVAECGMNGRSSFALSMGRAIMIHDLSAMWQVVMG